MASFNVEKQTFSMTFSVESYFSMMKSLCGLVACCDQLEEKEPIMLAATLLEEMTEGAEQHFKLKDD